MKKNYETIIIGGGPAGVSAAIYLRRAGKETLLVESSAPGGLLNKITEVKNYPGYIGNTGEGLAYNMFEQLMELEVPILTETVKGIESTNDKVIIRTDTLELEAKYIIIATGRVAKKLNFENEDKLVGNGVSYCVLCDGTLYKDKNVIVVGGGNSALQSAAYLSNICKKVTVVHRGQEFKAEGMLIDDIKEKSNVDILFNNVIKKANITNDVVKNIIIENNVTNKETQIDATGMFICIGYIPKVEILKNTNVNLENEYILADSGMRTADKRIYACGDAIKKEVYQIVTAVADGAIAAINIIDKLKK